MKLHAIQTGCVRIKPAQVEGRGRRLRRRLSVMIDRGWTAWLATYAWIIDHPEGVIVVDTGQGAHLLESSRSLHPYHRWQVAFRLEREEEIGPQRRALGVGRPDIKRVVLTHLHVDHDGGLAFSGHGDPDVARRTPGGARVDVPAARVSPESLADMVRPEVARPRPRKVWAVLSRQTPDRLRRRHRRRDARPHAGSHLCGRGGSTRRMVYLPTHDPESAARLAGCTCAPSSPL